LTIAMHEFSVGVFTPFLGTLSNLLDQALVHAHARKIDPANLLNACLYPNMYDLNRQAGETVRHAIVGCALLAGVNRRSFHRPNRIFQKLKTRIATTIAFLGGLAPAEITTSKLCSPSGMAQHASLPAAPCC
jgi:hypothetical protein